MTIPHTCLSTRFSGSARETEGRIRNIFRGQRRRPPAPLILLLLGVIALCGSLVACQTGGAAGDGGGFSSPVPAPSSPAEAPALEPPLDGEYLLEYPIQAGGRTLTLHLYVRPISEDYPDRRGVRQVAVTEGTQLLQTLPVQEALEAEWGSDSSFTGGCTECFDEAGLISIADLDADGNQDFGLFGWITAGANLPHYYWMWDPAEESFTYAFCLCNAEPDTGLTAPLPVAPRGLILSTTRESAAEYFTTRYFYSSALIPLYQIREKNTGSGTVRTDYVYLNGAWIQIPGDGGAIPDEILAQLAGRYGTEDYDLIDQTGLHTRFVQAGGGKTLVLAQSTGGPHAGGLDNLLLGVLDNRTWLPLEAFHTIAGDRSSFTAWHGGDGALYLLCSNSYVSQGSEGLSGLGFFRYDGDALERLTQPTSIAAAAWPEEMGGAMPADLLRPDSGFWQDHTAVAADCGLTIYRAGGSGGAQWTAAGFLPFA